MRTFNLTKAAVQDLKDIALYTEKLWGRDQRNHYLKQLDNRFHKIAKNPSIGKPCDYIKQGYFKLSEGSHIIYYTNITNERVEIIRVLHRRMDVDAQF
jgi:toxin ParE1/3/4